MKPINRHNPNKQQGAVLVMALVMLTVLTLIGVSSMSSSTLELKVAGNTQQHDIAFQAAQTVIDITASEDPLNTNNYQVFKIDPNDPAFEQIINYASADGLATAQAATTWVGCKKNIGSSLEEGKAPASNFFNVMATGMTITGSSSSVQVQGLRFPAAACAIDL
ncbi:MAG: pilus assembly PilX N-terminal domain-containing protein [Thiotrichales bacterium]|nr:MAG: pilus assembly PilX N-terminal domain-containing protein [Thiotrichales bacterium]